MSNRLQLFEQKIEEYFLSCYSENLLALLKPSDLEKWPFLSFSITRLHAALAEELKDENLVRMIGEKLIDIKLYFSYLLTIDSHFRRGATLIVGNGEIEKLNPRTISLLRRNHYCVFLLSVLIEQTLDLLWLIHERKPSNHQRGKWKKILELVRSKTGGKVVTEADEVLLLAFKEQFRTAEMHKMSMVRAFTSKPEWNHLQQEVEAISRVLAQIYALHVSAESQAIKHRTC